MFLITILAALSALLTAEAAISGRVYENCILLGRNRLQLSWTVRMADGAMDFELCGCGGVNSSGSTRNFVNEYMGFGLSADPTRTKMVGADAFIAYVDNNQGAFAIDYSLTAQTQCTAQGGVGACPDTWDIRGGCTNDLTNVTGFRRDRFQCVSFSRLMDTGDSVCDLPINVSNPNQYIVWAVGGFDTTAFRHFELASATDPPLNLGRSPSNQCNTGVRCSDCPGFKETIWDVRDRDATFLANIGPPAGERGYQSITGQAGWGIAWYLNGTLIPHLYVQRGRTYTFLAESGTNPDSFDYHPFYLTDSRTGGRDKKSASQRAAEIIYAGYNADGEPYGVGPYCAYDETTKANGILSSCGSEALYFANLVKTQCPTDVKPGNFSWTPDETSPNQLYYQCATHRNLGYKISVFPQILESSGFRSDAFLATTLLIAAVTGLL